MIKLLLWLWQLPQNVIGFLIVKITKAKKRKIGNIDYYTCRLFNSAVSLGKYIILDDIYLAYPDYYIKNTINHEYGHSKQSKILGWFYLLVVGAPSMVRNIYNRIAHKKWMYEKRAAWYYSGYPEKWADKLGGVKRSFAAVLQVTP